MHLLQSVYLDAYSSWFVHVLLFSPYRSLIKDMVTVNMKQKHFKTDEDTIYGGQNGGIAHTETGNV